MLVKSSTFKVNKFFKCLTILNTSNFCLCLLKIVILFQTHVYDRQKRCVEDQHKFGLSVSYRRVNEVRNKLALSVTERWRSQDCVLPISVPLNTFVTCSMDNIDQNGRVDFHGTAFSITAHLTPDNFGTNQSPFILN